MKWLCIILLTGMSATCWQPKKTRTKRHRSIQPHRDEGGPAPTRAHFVSVDSNWIAHYRELEKEFSYTVHDDENIKAVGDGFSVPMSVREHYQDMLRAKGGHDAQP